MIYHKICAHCGETFDTSRSQKIYCDRQHYRPCPICGKLTAMIDNDFSRQPKCCSTSCAQKLRQTKFKMKKCAICGKMFKPTSGVATVCSDKHYAECEICGKKFEIDLNHISDGVTTCSRECTKEKTRRGYLEKYGVEHPMQNVQVKHKFSDKIASKRTTILFYQEPRVNVIDGHDLIVYRLKKEVADDWLNKYHPFGAPRGNVLCLGLMKDNIIYCVMTFKKSKNIDYTAELSRLWMLPRYQVIDGYNILSTEASKFGINSIVAYVNLSFENVKDYESIGMKFVREMQKTRWWINADKKMTDASRRQYKLSKEELFDQGWISAFDCGQYVYEYRV